MGRVIHVDNSMFFRKIMRAFLLELGLESESFDKGQDALIAARTGGASSVITGLELPDMKGEEFIQQLATLDQTISVIVFSANTDEERLEYLETLGVVGIVEKTSNWREDLRKFFL